MKGTTNELLQLTVFAAPTVDARGIFLLLFKLGLTIDTKAGPWDCFATSLWNDSLAFFAFG
jgi:hypothetical protein